MNSQGIHSSAPTKPGAPRGSDVKVELTLTPEECMRVLTPCSKSVKGTQLIRASSRRLSYACTKHQRYNDGQERQGLPSESFPSDGCA